MSTDQDGIQPIHGGVSYSWDLSDGSQIAGQAPLMSGYSPLNMNQGGGRKKRKPKASKRKTTKHKASKRKTSKYKTLKRKTTKRKSKGKKYRSRSTYIKKTRSDMKRR